MTRREVLKAAMAALAAPAAVVGVPKLSTAAVLVLDEQWYPTPLPGVPTVGVQWSKVEQDMVIAVWLPQPDGTYSFSVRLQGYYLCDREGKRRVYAVAWDWINTTLRGFSLRHYGPICRNDQHEFVWGKGPHVHYGSKGSAMPAAEGRA